MYILLTGATGFVGSHILKALLKDGHKVSLVKRSSSDTTRIKDCLSDCKAYNLDETDLEDIFKGNRFTHIIHLATYYGRHDENYLKNIETNVIFPLRLMQAGIANGMEYFLNTDTFYTKQIYSEPGLQRRLYLQGYNLSKYQFWQWGSAEAVKEGVTFVNMKLEHVYGECDSMEKFIPFLVSGCKRNVPAIALSEGKQKRDFIYIADVAEAYCRVVHALPALTERNPGHCLEFEVGTGRMRSIREFAELIHSALGSSSLLEWGKLPMKEGEMMESKADISMLRNIGWEPLVVDEDEIKRVFVKIAEGYA